MGVFVGFGISFILMIELQLVSLIASTALPDLTTLGSTGES